MNLLLALLILPLTVHWWKPVDGRQEYIVRNTLNHHHDRVCGAVWPEGNGWGYYTLRTGGAREGLSDDAATEEAAKAVVERDCR